METPLTASISQGDKLRERVGIALKQSGVTKKQVQAALEYPGTGLEDEFTAAIVKYAKKMSGIVTPGKAQDTGLVPKGWLVNRDKPEGDVDLAKLDYSACPVHEDEEYVSGDTMIKRAIEQKAIGSLGFAAALLQAQNQGKEIFPVKSRGKHYFIMPLTELQDADGRGRVAYFLWVGERWELHFSRPGPGFGRRDRFVRRSE